MLNKILELSNKISEQYRTGNGNYIIINSKISNEINKIKKLQERNKKLKKIIKKI